jgi:hypothetical protein
MIPVGQRLGLGVEAIPPGGGQDKGIGAQSTFFTDEGSAEYSMSGSPRLAGGGLSAGYRVLEGVSVGGAFLLWYVNDAESDSTPPSAPGIEEGVDFAIQIGTMIESGRYGLLYGFSLAYTSLEERYVDISAAEAKDGTLPLVLEASVASLLLDGRIFASIRAMGDVYIDGRGGHVLRLLPVGEYWFLPFVAARLGAEYSHMIQDGEFAVGYGALAGLSGRFWRIRIDGNFTIREKPAQQLPGRSIPDWVVSAGIVLTPALVASR